MTNIQPVQPTWRNQFPEKLANSSLPVKTKKQRKEYSINRSNSFDRSSIPPDSRYQAAPLSIRRLENYKAGIKAGFPEEGEITGKRGPVQFPGIEAQRRYKRKSFAVIRSSFSLSLLPPPLLLFLLFLLLQGRCLLPDEKWTEIRPRVAVLPSKVFIARLKLRVYNFFLISSGGVNSRHEIVKLANQIPSNGMDGWMDGFLGIILRELLEKRWSFCTRGQDRGSFW